MISNDRKRHSFDIFKWPHKVFIEGHRGVNREIFENTIDSFKKAIEYNLDSIELDVWLTKDKVPIVVHGGFQGNLSIILKDISVNSNPNFFTFKQISSYEMKDSYQKIPSLNEVLDLCKNKIFLNIELKENNVIKTFERVIKLIEKKKMINQISINSFDSNYINLIERYNLMHKEKIEYGKNYKALFNYSLKNNFKFQIKNKYLNLYYKDISKEFVDKAHLYGNAVRAWFKMRDAEDETIYKRLFDCGIDVICCNEPNKAKEYRDTIYYNKK